MVQQHLRLEEILQHLNTTQSSCDRPFQILETCLEANHILVVCCIFCLHSFVRQADEAAAVALW